MFTSVPFNVIIQWLASKGAAINIPNLGRRSSHFYSVAENNQFIKVDGGKGKIDEKLWNTVCNRIDSLQPNERETATRYNDIRPYIQAPSVPALCRAYWEEQNAN